MVDSTMIQTIHINDLSEIKQAAQEFLEQTQGQKVFLFNAKMGVGKTTFIKALCQLLGVKGETASPTYSIVNQYEGKDHIIYHFDLYRLKSVEELLNIGFEDYLYQDAYIFIEWPEFALPFLDDYTTIQMEANEEGKRSLHIQLKSN